MSRFSLERMNERSEPIVVGSRRAKLLYIKCEFKVAVVCVTLPDLNSLWM